MNDESAFHAKLRSQMHTAVDGCISPADFGAHFLPRWFWNVCHTYCFVFKKNLRITNIQVAELLSLVRSHTKSAIMDLELRLSSLHDFDKQLSRFTETFSTDVTDTRTSLNAAVDRIVDSYANYFANLALLDLNFGSCLISIPPLYSIDLESICFLSGYIHSCGPCIYSRDIYHSRYSSFLKHLKEYVAPSTPTSRPILFRPYSHEDFTKHDRDQKDDLSSGLDELKIYSTKQYMGDLVLASMAEALRKEPTLSGVLTVAKPGHSGLDKRLRGHVDPERTFWLITDRPTLPFDRRHPPSLHESQYPANRHVLICYDQTFINDNPYHIFDENKPGWYDHTTIPHTLMGAMINITRPYWPSYDGHSRVTMFDPFVGGGTAFLESCKYNEVDFVGSDKESIAPLVTQDNLHFFSLSLSELEILHHSFVKVYENVSTPPIELDDKEEWLNSSEYVAFNWANKLLSAFLGGRPAEEVRLDELTVEKLPADERLFLGRLLFYTMLKANRRFSAALETKQISSDEVVARELGSLRKQMDRLLMMRRRMVSEPIKSDQSRAVFLGRYSKACSLNPDWLKSKRGKRTISIKRIEEVGDVRKYDVVVTDPPYGFNTHEDIEQLMKVYSDGLERIIQSLSADGQLVLALPDWSHTGRRIPAFAFKEFVIYNILQIAKKQGREAYQTATQVPRWSVDSFPPYYWESERALRRAILHFRFRDIVTSDDAAGVALESVIELA